jgi:hypothetical protein
VCPVQLETSYVVYDWYRCCFVHRPACLHLRQISGWSACSAACGDSSPGFSVRSVQCVSVEGSHTLATVAWVVNHHPCSCAAPLLAPPCTGRVECPGVHAQCRARPPMPHWVCPQHRHQHAWCWVWMGCRLHPTHLLVLLCRYVKPDSADARPSVTYVLTTLVLFD